MKKTVRIIALVLAMVLLTGCTLFPAKESTKSYSCRDLTMEISSKMKDVSGQEDFSGFTFALDSNDMAIFGLNETFAEYPVLEEYTTKDYADLLIQLYGVNSTVQERSGKDYHYLVYTADTELGEFTYMAGIFRNSNGFWMIQVCTPTDKYDQEEFFSYLDTVKLS
ncbi:MAG: hypothetical protein IKK72_00020 [Oscillospiraceae bacterium]|nr:hypothetical protein [Oscillospiraceae bacterium]